MRASRCDLLSSIFCDKPQSHIRFYNLSHVARAGVAPIDANQIRTVRCRLMRADHGALVQLSEFLAKRGLEVGPLSGIHPLTPAVLAICVTGAVVNVRPNTA